MNMIDSLENGSMCMMLLYREIGSLLIFHRDDSGTLSHITLEILVYISLYHFSLPSDNLPGSIYINNAILGGVELAANAVAIWIIKLGRRPAIVGSFAMAAASMLAICFAQREYITYIISNWFEIAELNILIVVLMAGSVIPPALCLWAIETPLSRELL